MREPIINEQDNEGGGEINFSSFFRALNSEIKKVVSPLNEGDGCESLSSPQDDPAVAKISNALGFHEYGGLLKGRMKKIKGFFDIVDHNPAIVEKFYGAFWDIASEKNEIFFQSYIDGTSSVVNRFCASYVFAFGNMRPVPDLSYEKKVLNNGFFPQSRLGDYELVNFGVFALLRHFNDSLSAPKYWEGLHELAVDILNMLPDNPTKREKFFSADLRSLLPEVDWYASESIWEYFAIGKISRYTPLKLAEFANELFRRLSAYNDDYPEVFRMLRDYIILNEGIHNLLLLFMQDIPGRLSHSSDNNVVRHILNSDWRWKYAPLGNRFALRTSETHLLYSGEDKSLLDRILEAYFPTDNREG